MLEMANTVLLTQPYIDVMGRSSPCQTFECFEWSLYP
jgi:hypothetical protein